MFVTMMRVLGAGVAVGVGEGVGAAGAASCRYSAATHPECPPAEIGAQMN